jgi:hypothetical protein
MVFFPGFLCCPGSGEAALSGSGGQGTIMFSLWARCQQPDVLCPGLLPLCSGVCDLSQRDGQWRMHQAVLHRVHRAPGQALPGSVARVSSLALGHTASICL